MASRTVTTTRTARRVAPAPAPSESSQQQPPPLPPQEERFKGFFSFVPFDFKISNNYGIHDGDKLWQFVEDPHSARRKEILRKYPQVKQLMGYDPHIAYVTTAEVVVQVITCWLIQDLSWPSIIVLAYCFGGMLNHSLGTALHEIGHNLAFGHRRAWMNRVLSLVCNLPIVVPLAVSYRKYHADHHHYMGDEANDADVPCRLEAYLFRTPLTKIVWAILQPVIYVTRTMYKVPKKFNAWDYTNLVLQLIFSYTIWTFFGTKALVYLAASTFLGFGLHPMSGHFLSEHYLFSGGQATHSYYGPLNWFLFNVGYHNEHHDFPYIPYRRLPELKRMAPEYYDNLPYHTSLCKVTWDFIFNAKLGPHYRGLGYTGDVAAALQGTVKARSTIG